MRVGEGIWKENEEDVGRLKQRLVALLKDDQCTPRVFHPSCSLYNFTGLSGNEELLKVFLLMTCID